jgi:hypothetical protein
MACFDHQGGTWPNLQKFRHCFIGIALLFTIIFIRFKWVLWIVQGLHPGIHDGQGNFA